MTHDSSPRTSLTTERVLADIEAIAKAQGAGEFGDIWEGLAREHRDLIAEEGFENFKRTVNFRYNQWGVATFHHWAVRQLLALLLRQGRIPTGVLAHADLSDTAHIHWFGPIQTSTSMRRRITDTRRLLAYAVYCGLLWQLAESHDSLNCLSLPEPEFGHPLPIKFRGRVISQDLATTSLELNRIAEFVPLKQINRVLEIGAGYGRSAYVFRSLFPNAQYVIVDVSPALAISQNYLAAVFGEQSVGRFNSKPTLSEPLCFLLPHQLDALPDGYFDLVINVSSFDEMPAAVSSRYVQSIKRLCHGYAYFNGRAHVKELGNRLGLEELPYGDWNCLYSRPHLLFRTAGFVEKIFNLAR